MIDFLRALRAHAAYGQRMLGFIPALVIAEMFYKSTVSSSNAWRFL